MLPVALGFISAHALLPVPSGRAWAQRSGSPQIRTSKAKCAHVQFSGEVTRNQKYVHPLPDGLEFRLLPSPEGWGISIGRPGDQTHDYVEIATPPYHGANPIYIDAWDFRNADNTGANEGQVNAPTDVRPFSFVLNQAQYQKFSDALDLYSGGNPGATERERNDAADFLVNSPRHDGSLSILAMRLGGLEKGMRPWFESMKFDVDLCFPPSTALPSEKRNSAKSQPPKKNP